MFAFVLGISVNKCWRTNKLYSVLINGFFDDYVYGVEIDLVKLWCFIFQFLLFGVIGMVVSFKDVTSSTIFKFIGFFFIGICICLFMVYVVVGGGELL